MPELDFLWNYKVRWFKHSFCYLVYSMFLKIFAAVQIFLYIFLLKWGIKWGKFGVRSSKILFYFWLETSFLFFSNGHIHNVVSRLSNIVKIYVENDNVVSTLCNLVQINAEIENVDLTLFNIVSFNIDVRNVVLRLIWRCATSRHHINLKTTLKRRWNVCWVVFYAKDK